MKAKELMIGNWIYQHGSLPVQVSSIGSNHINGYEHEYYGAIPLTPEILEKAGFADKEADGYYERSIDLPDLIHPVKKVLFLSTNGIDGWAVYIRDEYISLIHNTHQLQNLYYALTGTELTINL